MMMPVLAPRSGDMLPRLGRVLLAGARRRCSQGFTPSTASPVPAVSETVLLEATEIEPCSPVLRLTRPTGTHVVDVYNYSLIVKLAVGQGTLLRPILFRRMEVTTSREILLLMIRTRKNTEVTKRC